MLTHIFDWIERLMPFFRAAWVGSIIIGVALVALALLLKRDPSRKTSPWVAGIIGTIMVINSGTQLIASIL